MSMAHLKAAAPDRADRDKFVSVGAEKTRQQSATVAVGSRRCGVGPLPLQHSISNCSAAASGNIARVGDCVQVNHAASIMRALASVSLL